MDEVGLQIDFPNSALVAEFSSSLNEKNGPDKEFFKNNGFRLYNHDDRQNYDPLTIILMLKMITAGAAATGAIFGALLAFFKFIRFFSKQKDNTPIKIKFDGETYVITGHTNDAQLEIICNAILAKKG